MLTRTELGYSMDDYIVLAIGDLNANKNHKALIEALPCLPDRVKVCIVGEGSLRQELSELAVHLGVFDRVVFLGFRKDIAAILNACDLFCLPSKRGGLPVSLIEALATGSPALTSDARGCSGVLGDLGHRFVVRGSDSRSLAKQIMSIVSDGYPVDSASLRQRAAAFGLDSAIAATAKVYERIFCIREAA